MDFRAIIELVKYTLALSAAGFVYTLEKLTPAPTELARWYALVLLAIFFVSALGGILIFSAATKALHLGDGSTEIQKTLIRYAAYFHIISLGIGVLLLGGRLVEKVLTEAPAPPQSSRALAVTRA